MNKHIHGSKTQNSPASVSTPGYQNKQQNDCHQSSVFLSVQTKLDVGSVDDPLEHEADAMADKIMSMQTIPAVTKANSNVQRKCTECENEEEEIKERKPLASFVQRKESAGGTIASESVSNQINSSKGNGSAMDANTKSFMENRFGADLSDVKIHTSDEAILMNRQLSAKAFTVGNDIYFNEGQYQPNSDSGKHLLAHELVHTVQQNGLSTSIQTKKQHKPNYVEGGGATPGKGDGIDVVFIINSPGDEFTGDVVKYIQDTLIGQEYYIVDGLDQLFDQLNTIATGFEYHYVPIVAEMKLPREIERISDIRVGPRKVRRIRLVAHGQTVIGGVSMRPPGQKEKKFVPPSEIVEYSKQPRIQKIVKSVMIPDAIVEFWGCNIGAVPDAGVAWSNLFQSKFRAIGDTFKTGFNKFYRRPEKGETGEIVDGLRGRVVQVLNSSEVHSRGKNLKKSFNSWLLKTYAELVTNGDILPIKGMNDQLIFMENLFDKSNGEIKYIQIERKNDEKLIRPGNAKDWKKLWVEFPPVKISDNP